MASLTSFISIPDVRQKLNETFPKPQFKLKVEIVAPPLTKNYHTVGTAFDYLLRFHLKYLNPESMEKPWVAELGTMRLGRNPESFITKECKPEDVEKVLGKAIDIIGRAKALYSTYQQTGKMTDELIESAICLARLDLLFRPGIIDPNFGVVDKRDVEDLRNLVSAIDSGMFKSETMCVLNPTFGEGSVLVGGADCDILMDDTLIDVKTTKTLRLERRHFNQLVGYYILFTIGGITGAPSATIKNIGVYFSRYSKLYTIPVTTLTENSNFSEFRTWFINKAKEVFKHEALLAARERG